jgi:hypothetical protein
MIGSDAKRFARAERQPSTVIGLAALARMAFRGADLGPVARSLGERRRRDPHDAAALLDLSLLELFQGREQHHALLQAEALRLHRLYRHEPVIAVSNPLRVLALAAPGNLMANTPIEFLVENSDIALDVLFIAPGSPLPDSLPPHDVAFVAVAEGDANRPILDALARRLPTWPRPVINEAGRISRLSRDGVSRLLASVPGAYAPINLRVERARLAAGDAPVDRALQDCRFPIIVRPVGSHAGEGLEKLDDGAAVAAYLARQPQAEFFIAPFVDYSGSDGLFRKYRVVLIDGQAYAGHMAISSRWMIHYLNADMIDNPRNRAEEAAFMRDFDASFGARHQTALREIARRCGLDYLIMDCAETPDGRLLVFEVGNAMIVHSMDPELVFPYKTSQMRKLFGAFQAMLRARAGAERQLAASA